MPPETEKCFCQTFIVLGREDAMVGLLGECGLAGLLAGCDA
jgi:hypothetical protein